MVKQPPIIKTNEWGAAPPKEKITKCGRYIETLFHHTAGHHVEITHPKDESFTELVNYAKSIQSFHFSEGWIDSGHNFLVGRNGMILVGRHQSYTQCKNGQMVVSAHCPGHNQSPGVEIEHIGTEKMTAIQFSMVSWLFAWLLDTARVPGVVIYPHRQFFATNCPGALMTQLPAVKEKVSDIRNGKVPL